MSSGDLDSHVLTEEAQNLRLHVVQETSRDGINLEWSVPAHQERLRFPIPSHIIFIIQIWKFEVGTGARICTLVTMSITTASETGWLSAALRL